MDGYQLKIHVEGSSSQIWRKVEVPAIYSFMDVHQLIQTIFGLDDYNVFEFEFELMVNDIKYLVLGQGHDEQITDSMMGYIEYFERIDDYFKPGMVLNYHFDFHNNWKFSIEVEQTLKSVSNYPVVIDYCGDNLISDCGGIENYEKIVAFDEDFDKTEIQFDINFINDLLTIFGAEEVLNNVEYRKEFVAKLEVIKELISKRNIDNYQVIKLISNSTTYWVIIKTIEGYVIELFDSYNAFLEGFYNLPNEGINNAFCNCWTFLLSDQELESDVTIDDENLFAVFRNEAGYIPDFLDVQEAEEIYEWLEEFVIAIREDDNTSEADEIIEIYIENGIYKESSIFVHEPKVDFSRYDYNYLGEFELETIYEDTGRVCLDVVALPNEKTVFTSELSIYAIITGQEDYLVREVSFPSLRNIGEALIDEIIEYSNDFGKPKQLVISNLNVLFLVWYFIKENDIDYIEDDIEAEINNVIYDAFDFNKKLNNNFDNPYIQELLERFDGKSEEEIEEELNKIIANMELLN